MFQHQDIENGSMAGSLLTVETHEIGRNIANLIDFFIFPKYIGSFPNIYENILSVNYNVTKQFEQVNRIP